MVGIALLVGTTMAVGAPSSLCGAYTFVPSAMPAKHRGVAQAIFGQTPLLLDASGQYYYAFGRQQGFWRVEGRRLVLVSSGFFGVPYPIPDGVLKVRWPSYQTEGLILDVRSDGSLVLKSFQAIGGPIVFRRAPKKSTLRLISEGMKDDDITSYAVIKMEAEARFDEIVDVILNPNVALQTRSWATQMFPENLSAERARRLLALTLNFPDKTLDANQRRRLQKNLAMALLKKPSNATFEAILANRDRTGIKDITIITAIARNRMMAQASVLDQFVESDNQETLAAACEAAGQIGYALVLPRIRELADHEAASVRISALGAILRLSDDRAEKLGALKRLHRSWDADTYSNVAIIKAWRDCGMREAVSYLIACLEKSPDPFARREAATALGDMGFPEAVPALLLVKRSNSLEAKQPLNRQGDFKELSSAIDAAFSDADVRKAAVEALWKFDQKSKKRANRQAPVTLAN